MGTNFEITPSVSISCAQLSGASSTTALTPSSEAFSKTKRLPLYPAVMNATTAPLSTLRRRRRPSTVRMLTLSSGMVCSMPTAGDMGIDAAMRARWSSLKALGREPMTAL